jgi:pyridoxal/pyridoxine/pyridoxamine kinase
MKDIGNDQISNDSSHFSSSLPSPVTLDETNMKKSKDMELLINPLGAGDTASAIFLLEYVDTRDPIDAFRHGIAAASASCLSTEQTAHFDLQIKQIIYERIQIEEFKFDASHFSNNNHTNTLLSDHHHPTTTQVSG